MTELTPALLAQIMQCPTDRAVQCFPGMVQAMRGTDITDSDQIICFLVQCKWESTGLVNFAELGPVSYFAKYNNRADLGNGPNDGYPFRGSGPIQVTGRHNFTVGNQRLHANGGLPADVDIVSDPDEARTVQWGFAISADWWQNNGGAAASKRTEPISTPYGSFTGLAAANIRCGRLVNRGNVNSSSAAQGEDGRIDAFNHVSQYGALSLPAPTPPPPVPPIPPTPEEDDDIMPYKLARSSAKPNDIYYYGGGIFKKIPNTDAWTAGLNAGQFPLGPADKAKVRMVSAGELNNICMNETRANTVKIV